MVYLRFRQGAGGERAQQRGGTVEVVSMACPSGEGASTAGVISVVNSPLEKEFARAGGVGSSDFYTRGLLFINKGQRGAEKEAVCPRRGGKGGELDDERE